MVGDALVEDVPGDVLHRAGDPDVDHGAPGVAVGGNGLPSQHHQVILPVNDAGTDHRDLARLEHAPEGTAVADEGMVAQFQAVGHVVEAEGGVAAVPEGQGVGLLVHVDHVGHKGGLAGHLPGDDGADAGVHVALADNADAVVGQAAEHAAGLALDGAHFRPALDGAVVIAELGDQLFQRQVGAAVVFQVFLRQVAVLVGQAGELVQAKLAADLVHVGVDRPGIQLCHAVKDQLELGALHADAEQAADGQLIKGTVVEGGGPVAQQAQAGVGQLLFGGEGGDQRFDPAGDFRLVQVAVDGPALAADALDGSIVHHGAAHGVGPQPLLSDKGSLVGGPQQDGLAQLLGQLAADVVAGEGADHQQHHVRLVRPQPVRAGGGLLGVGDNLGIAEDIDAGQLPLGPVAIERLQLLRALPGPAAGQGGDKTDIQFGFYHGNSLLYRCG